jgi:formylglycine-generating enzyme required for sulfatase activity
MPTYDDAKALLHLIARADNRDQDVAEFVDSYSKTIAALCRRLEALERGANDLPAPAAPVDAGPVANALTVAEAALADVAEGEAVSPHAVGCLHWAEARCTEALAAIRPVMRRHGIRTSEFPPAAPAPAPARAGSADSPIPMVPIPSGSFLMGSPDDEPGRSEAEGPQHGVTLGGFWMARTPITQAQWRMVASWPRVNRDLGLDPSRFKGDCRPVEQVSWLDAMEFCHRLSERTGKKYTLPSEAQWEYACRAGTNTPFHFGPTISTEVANYDGRYIYGQGSKGIYRERTIDVASFPANGWGLHDMHGSVWEWCLDEWHDSYEGAPTDGSAWMEGDSLGESPAACCAAGRGPTAPGTAARLPATAAARTTATASSVSASVASDAIRLLRGGSWYYYPGYCRSAYRSYNLPDLRLNSIGFRVCCLPQD